MATPPIPWRGRYEPGVPQGLSPADRSFPQLLVEAAGAAPGQTALVYYRRRSSYAQLNARVSTAAQAFRRFGLQRGDRVAVALPNAPGTCDVLLGIMRAGGVVLALPDAAPTAGLLATLADQPLRLAITWSGARTDLRTALAATAPLVMVDPVHDLPLLPRIMARMGGLLGRGALGRETQGARLQRWERFIRGAKGGDDPAVGPEDPALELPLAGGGTVAFNHAQLTLHLRERLEQRHVGIARERKDLPVRRSHIDGIEQTKGRRARNAALNAPALRDLRDIGPFVRLFPIDETHLGSVGCRSRVPGT